MTLFMPIKPEPASRIYSGKKLFELRKASPPETGFVYLYETRDETTKVYAIRGGFYFRKFLNLPLEELWMQVGEQATSREKFLRYFGKRERGVALVIERVEHLSRSIREKELKGKDPTFDLPRHHWTYHPVDETNPVVRYLDSLGRTEIIVHATNLAGTARGCLRVARLSRSEEPTFEEFYNQYVRPNYPESEDYARHVIETYRKGVDRYGYFTKRKTIWSFFCDAEHVGFTVVTEKRGGSIKFGPTILLPKARGQGIGTALRLLVEQEYPEARKAYNTLPDDNLAALRYVLKAGYRIEAHLQHHYRPTGGELVVGKLLKKPSLPVVSSALPSLEGDLHLEEGWRVSPQRLADSILDLLGPFYGEVDRSFVEGIVAAMRAPFSLAHKSKRVFLAARGEKVAGILIATPKRGGALKCSPVVISGEDEDCFRLLLTAAQEAFPQRPCHKFYLHLPVLETWLLRSALSLGFAPEGILSEPYQPGIDVIALGRILQ
jgi:predicted transcriptional regulator/GNAT superfamily N-acetyltransferase